MYRARATDVNPLQWVRARASVRTGARARARGRARVRARATDGTPLRVAALSMTSSWQRLAC